MDIQNDKKDYRHLPYLVCSCQYHVIFCPKYRRKVLKDGVDTRLKELVISKQEELEMKVLSIEVMPDHVHLLLDINPKKGIYNVVTNIKGFTSHTLREEFPFLKTKLPTLWSRGKFISTVGSVSLDTVKQYIEDQKNK